MDGFGLMLVQLLRFEAPFELLMDERILLLEDLEDCVRQIFEQMESIGHLNGLRSAP